MNEEEQVREWLDAERQRTDLVAAELCRHVAQLTAQPPGSGRSQLLPLSLHEAASSSAATLVMNGVRSIPGLPQGAGSPAAQTAVFGVRAVTPLVVVPRWIYTLFVCSLICSGLLVQSRGGLWPALFSLLALNLSWWMWLKKLLRNLASHRQRPVQFHELLFLHRPLIELSQVLAEQGRSQGRTVNGPSFGVRCATLASFGWLLTSALLLWLDWDQIIEGQGVLLAGLYVGTMGIWGLVMWGYERAQRALW